MGSLVEYFKPGFGIVTESDQTTENSGLFLAQYILDKRNAKGMTYFLEKMQRSKLPNGLYLRSFHHTERGVSHDEISGMMASSFIYNTVHHKIIWGQLKQNWGAYPAVVSDWTDSLPYNLANYYAWGSYNYSMLSRVFFPFYLANMIIAINKEVGETSSKIIYGLELNSMPKTMLNSWLLEIYENKMIEQYGKNYKLELRKIYFTGEKPEFPLFGE
jgi:hypothetical protein